MRKLYRIEHPESGFGPYWMGGPYLETPYSDEAPQRPGPQNDPQLKTKPQWREWEEQGDLRFAFTSKPQLKRWFTTNRRKALIRAGFKIAIYSAAEVLASKKQALFNLRGANLEKWEELANV